MLTTVIAPQDVEIPECVEPQAQPAQDTPLASAPEPTSNEAAEAGQEAPSQADDVTETAPVAIVQATAAAAELSDAIAAAEDSDAPLRRTQSDSELVRLLSAGY